MRKKDTTGSIPSRSKIFRNIIIGVLLIAVIAISLYFRVILPSAWLQGQTNRMSTVDAYYQLRMADLIKTHNTDLPATDPYFTFNGEVTFNKIKNPIIWPIVISNTADILNNFHVPNPVDTAGLFLPPFFAALAIIGIFILTAILFNGWIGVIAALLMGTLAGEFMGRSILGSADYHVFEVFLLGYTMLFLFMANKAQSVGRTVWGIIFSILAGLMMAIYARAWFGTGYLFILLATAYMLYLIVLSLRNETPNGAIYAIMSIVPSSAIFFYIIITQLTNTGIDNGLLVLALVSFAIILISTPLQAYCVNSFNRYIFPFLSLFVVVAAVLIIYFFVNSYFTMLTSYLAPLIGWRYESRTAEEVPAMLQGDQFTLNVLWGNFTASLYLCLIGVGVLIKRIRTAAKFTVFDYSFLIVGTIIMLLSTLAMRRFAYYFVIFVSILSGFIIYTMVTIVTDYLKRNKNKLKWWDKLSDAFLLIIFLAFILTPNFMIAQEFKYPMEGTLTPAWEDAMLWLRSNSPEPFADNNYFYANYNTETLKPQYSVMSWWDYGYWIMYIAHRVPVCNPGSLDRNQAAAFLTTGDVGGAQKVLSLMKSRYITIDYQMTTGKFSAMPTYVATATPEIKALANLEEKHNYIWLYNMGSVYQENAGKLQQTTVFYPDYYRSMTARLFNFDGKAVKAAGCPVVILTETNGVKIITKIIDTPSLAEATNYISTLKLDANQSAIMCGFDPFISCVDLEPLTDYKLVKVAGSIDLSFVKKTNTPEVKIFEYTGGF